MPAGWGSMEPRVRPQWDAATIVSTYSNADHHPRVLADGVSLTSARTGYGPKRVDEGAGRAHHGSTEAASVDGSGLGGPIRLSKKTGLPVGFAATLRRGGRPPPPLPRAGALNASAAHSADIQGDGSLDGGGDADGSGASEPPFVPAARQRGESKAEQAARKAAVKAQRRERREDKKALRTAFKSEELRQVALASDRKAAVPGVTIQ